VDEGCNRRLIRTAAAVPVPNPPTTSRDAGAALRVISSVRVPDIRLPGQAGLWLPEISSCLISANFAQHGRILSTHRHPQVLAG
jgi:hypothetical protein